MASPPAGRAGQTRTFHHSLYTPETLAAARARGGPSISVCLPARECAATVGSIVESLLQLRAQGAIDEVVVIDAASSDGTARVAERAGAVVHQEGELMPEHGPVAGKGDAMWRALPVLSGDVVCFLDADSSGFAAHFAVGLIGPLLCEPGVDFAKAFYRRALHHAGGSVPEGGGRVNHLTARPALQLFYPELAAIRQPLAGEVAARRDLLWRLPFMTGYGVEIAMLIDVWRDAGLDAIAQVDLDEHRNRSQPLRALTPMALTVLATIVARAQREGRIADRALATTLQHALLERPSHAGLGASQGAPRSDATRAPGAGAGGRSGR
jgi:glucosyl-3-phosphoglycerate synthase